MHIRALGLTTGILCLVMASSGFTEEKAPSDTVQNQKKGPKSLGKSEAPSQPEAPDTPPGPEGEATEEAPSDRLDVILENTLEMCRDGEDNDADSHVDCDDQDCEIFAICVSPQKGEQTASAQTPPVQVPLTVTMPELGHLCSDRIDNDQNGLIDCHEPACKASRYCRKVMYERPEPKDKAPLLLINAGVGLAMPNYRVPTAKTRWINPENGEAHSVPFDPDMGVMLDLQLGYLFMPWMGAGVSFKSAFTYASNRELYFITSDDPDTYKYVGSKFYGNMSAFVRFQWIFDRIVPYVSLHMGYSVYQNTWHIYDPENTWSEIDEYEVDDSNYIYGERTEVRTDRRRHFTFAVEPGFDVFIVRRMFGLGLKAWLPVIANKNSEGDNLGILLNMTFTPIWREPVRLKPEYAAGQQTSP